MRLPAFSLMISLVLANLIGTCYLLVIIRQKKRIRLLHGETHQSLRSDMLRYAIPLLPNNIAWWVLNVSDRTIISMFIGAAANGMYAIANKFAFVPSILFGIFNMSWSESASLHITSRDRDVFFFEGVRHVLAAILICNSGVCVGDRYILFTNRWCRVCGCTWLNTHFGDRGFFPGDPWQLLCDIHR